MALETVGVRAVVEDFGLYISRTQQLNAATSSIGTTAQKAGQLGAGLTTFLATAAKFSALAAAALGGLSIKGAAEFSTTLAKIDALTNTTTEDTQRLGKGLLEIARVVPKSPNELGAAAYFALSSGITDVNEALDLVEAASKASAAGLGETKDIVDIVTAAMNAYGKENLTAARATDILVATVREGKGEPAAMATALGSLLPLAAALKVPFEDLAAVFASLTNSLGGSGGAEQAATQLRGILSQLASPSEQAKNALAEAEAGVKHLSEKEIALRDAHSALSSASDGLTSANRSLARATEDAAKAQRDQTQAEFDARRETLSVAEAQLHLQQVRAKAPATALDQREAIQAVADAEAQLREEQKKGGANARNIARAQLEVARAQQRLREVRAGAPQQALDLKNAELALEEAQNRVGSSAKRQAENVKNAQDRVADAQGEVRRASENTATAQAKLTLESIHQRDAFADLRKEIAERGIIPALQHIRDIFGGDVEGLSKIFPDVRGFIGFLSAIESQGGQTVEIQKRIATSFGITEEAFARMSKEASFQAGLLKNTLNVALIQLGTVALPAVNEVLQAAVQLFPKVGEAISNIASALPGVFSAINSGLSGTFGQLLGGKFNTDFFSGVVQSAKKAASFFSRLGKLFNLGLQGGDIGGQFSVFEKAAFNVGAFITQTLIPAFTDAKQAVHLFFLSLAGGDAGGNLSSLQQTFLDLGKTVRTTWQETIQPAIVQAAAAIKKAYNEDIQPALVAFGDIVLTVGKFVVDNWGTIQKVLSVGLAIVVQTVNTAFATFGNQLKVLSGFVQGVDDLIHGRWSEVWDDLKKIAGAAADEALTSVKTAFGGLPAFFVQLGVDAAKSAASAGVAIGKAFGNAIIDAINDFVSSLGGRVLIPSLSLGKLGSTPEVKIPSLGRPIPRLERGGILNGAQFALLGESGAEAVLPLTRPARSREILSSLPPGLVASLMPRGNGGGSSLNVTAQGFTLTDMEHAAVAGVREAHRRARSSVRRSGAVLSRAI